MDIQQAKTEMIKYYKEYGYSKGYLKRLHAVFNHLINFMDSQGLTNYEESIGEDFLKFKCETSTWEDLSKAHKGTARLVRTIDHWLKTGTVAPIKERSKKIPFVGEIGTVFNDFIEYAYNVNNRHTVKHHRIRLTVFYLFLTEKEKSIKDIDAPLIFEYITTLKDTKSLFERYANILSLRAFFRYLCKNECLTDNSITRWEAIMALPKHVPAKIPSVYSPEEVENVIKCIDRSTAIGKRNYAMILLAARYGLRASDIVGLRHCNIDWENNKILIRQAKTDKEIELPLFEEIGSAIIEYLKYGRPKSDLPYIFLSHSIRGGVMTSSRLGGCVADAMRNAGIDSTGKRHGTHSLRHSLASNLLKANETMPVISEILGHENTDTTKIYLQIDYNQLLKCALEVPFIPSEFYENLYS